MAKQYSVIVLNRFNVPSETIRTELSLKDAKQVAKDATRILGKKTRVIENPAFTKCKGVRINKGKLEILK